jgi:hypothetical protein
MNITESDVLQFLKEKLSESSINLSIEDWVELNSKFTKEEIRKGLAEYIIVNKINFPFRDISYLTVNEKFEALRRGNALDFVSEPDPKSVVEKYDDYKYPYSKHGKFLIEFGHYYNDISNYFQQNNRMSCGSYGFESPLDIWNSHDLLLKMNWIFWRMGTSTINETNIRGSFRLGAYVATQFKPHVATVIYNITKSKSVLDMSMGWGDRLAGFYASKATSYVGCDPNPQTFEVYKKQCMAYEEMLGCLRPEISENINDGWWKCVGKKSVLMYNKPAEDIDWSEQKETMDCVFTSPPYFSTELYNKGGEKEEDQSWSRYSEYNNWKEKFYLPMLKISYESLKPTGVMMINIMDPTVKGKRHRSCDEMFDYVTDELGGNFIGQVGMRIKQRPKNIDKKLLSEHLSTNFIENVWCFSKQNYVFEGNPSLESIMG